MHWWKITHHLEYHGDNITETRYIFAESTAVALDIMSVNIHPKRVLTDLYSLSIEKTPENQVDRGLVWDFSECEGEALRNKLVSLALSWQDKMGVAPSITSTISEFDAAMLIGCSYEQYAIQGQYNTAVTKGHDFIYNGIRYQVKACRPSGKRGSNITKVPQVRNYGWDQLVWIMYNESYEIQEAWLWDVEFYMDTFPIGKRISPADMRNGVCLKGLF